MGREFQNTRVPHVECHGGSEADICKDIPARCREFLLLGYLIRLESIPSGNGCFDIAWACGYNCAPVSPLFAPFLSLETPSQKAYRHRDVKCFLRFFTRDRYQVMLTMIIISWRCLSRYDALIYARALSDRSPGTHSLHLMERADHNFTKRQDDVVSVILQWWAARQLGELRTGIWLTDVGPKDAKL